MEWNIYDHGEAWQSHIETLQGSMSSENMPPMADKVIVIPATLGTDAYSSMTKREYFAAMALQGALSSDGCLPAMIKSAMGSKIYGSTEDAIFAVQTEVATLSVAHADALIKALNIPVK